MFTRGGSARGATQGCSYCLPGTFSNDLQMHLRGMPSGHFWRCDFGEQDHIPSLPDGYNSSAGSSVPFNCTPIEFRNTYENIETTLSSAVITEGGSYLRARKAFQEPCDVAIFACCSSLSKRVKSVRWKTTASHFALKMHEPWPASWSWRTRTTLSEGREWRISSMRVSKSPKCKDAKYSRCNDRQWGWKVQCGERRCEGSSARYSYLGDSGTHFQTSRTGTSVLEQGHGAQSGRTTRSRQAEARMLLSFRRRRVGRGESLSLVFESPLLALEEIRRP